MERSVDPRLGGVVPRQVRQAQADRLERERVVAQQAGRLVQERLGALDALPVVGLRLGLAEPAHAAVGHLHPENVLRHARLA